MLASITPLNLPSTGSEGYVQLTKNPQYNKLILCTNDQDDLPRTKFVFYCCVGCFLGFEVLVVDANNKNLDFTGCRWSCDGPFLNQIRQDEYRGRAGIIQPGNIIGTNKEVAFGWFCPGTFTFSFDLTIEGKDIGSQCVVIVSEPSIEKLFIEMPKLDGAESTSPTELGPVRIVSRIKTDEVSGTFGFTQSTHLVLERSCMDGSKQVIQTPETFSITLNTGSEKSAIKEAQYISCSEEKTLITENVTHFNKMFKNPECLEIKMNKNLRTFVAFQPDINCYSGIIKTFIVKYMREYLEWGCITNAVRAGISWNLQDVRWKNDTKGEDISWTTAEWSRTMSDPVIEAYWTKNKFMDAAI